MNSPIYIVTFYFSPWFEEGFPSALPLSKVLPNDTPIMDTPGRTTEAADLHHATVAINSE